MKNINISFPECLVFPGRIRGNSSGVAFAGDYGCDFSVDFFDEGSGAGVE